MDILLILMLGFGFAFILIQRTRKGLTFRMRLASSVISIIIAGYLILFGVMRLTWFVGGLLRGEEELAIYFAVLSMIGLVVAYRTIMTDIRTWRWYQIHRS